MDHWSDKYEILHADRLQTRQEISMTNIVYKSTIINTATVRNFEVMSADKFNAEYLLMSYFQKKKNNTSSNTNIDNNMQHIYNCKQ
jgi:uncharacterized protein YfcZ (UPF0381/DUF406 family)